MAVKWKTTKRDYSNVQADDTTEDNQGESQETSGGNTGLPFGLCKKYGINVPQGATPRDAWNLLAGRGIYPPWTEKGKDQYKQGGGNDISGKDIAKDYATIRDKLSKFTPQYRNTVEKAFENLNDSELLVFQKVTEDMQFVNGSGWYDDSKGRIVVPDGSATPLDTKLGFDNAMTTLFHEYGHCLDWKMGKVMNMRNRYGVPLNWTYSEDVKNACVEDCASLSKEIFAEQGLGGQLDLDRITQRQKDAIIKWAQEKTGVDKIFEKKKKSDFVKQEPSDMFLYEIYSGKRAESEIKRLMSWGYTEREASQKLIQRNKENEEHNRQEQERYNREMSEWNNYIQSEEYKTGLREWESYNNWYTQQKIETAPAIQAYSFIADFFGTMTQGKICLYDNGISGHQKSYYKKSLSVGCEIWAEYCSFKLTQNDDGLQLFKKYLPKTFNTFEQQYGKTEGLFKWHGTKK